MRRSLLTLVFCLTPLYANAATITNEVKILPDDGVANDWFANTVDVDGDTAVLAARGADTGGVAYVFDIETGEITHRLVPEDVAANDAVGYDIAVSGNIAVVSSLLDDDGGNNSGSAYLFNTDTGEQIAKLNAEDAAAVDHFSSSVAISDSAVVVASRYDDDHGASSGSVYVFDPDTGEQVMKITPEDGAASQVFGSDVAISGTTAIIGAIGDDDVGFNKGAAYVYDTQTGEQLAKLTAGDPENVYSFGNAVDVSDTFALVGNWNNTENGDRSGAAYLFDWQTGEEIYKFTPDDAAESDYFGIDVALYGDIAAVGAYRSEGDEGQLNVGAVYLFDINSGGQIDKIVASDGLAYSEFGYNIAFDDGSLLVSAYLDDDNGRYSGSAYLYSVDVAPVPLPAGLWLLGSALGLLTLRRRISGRVA